MLNLFGMELNSLTRITNNFYDGDGLRVSRTDNINGITTYYVWDSENPTGYPQVLEEIENNQVVRRYGYGLFLETIDIWNGTAFDRFYIVRDGTNSVRMLLDSTGNVSATYDYDAFGNILSVTNTNPITVSNSFGFHSEYKDPTTNLVYLRARWYQPENGRFVGMDRWEGNVENPSTLNKYSSFNNNPTNMTDPTGNSSIMEVGVIIGGLSIMALMPSNLYATGDSKEDKIKAIILAFVFASVKTGIDIDVLGSLGWSESPSYSLGYWDRNTNNSPSAHGIMQLWGEKYAGLSDMENIRLGAVILQEKHSDALKFQNNGYFKVDKVKYDLTPDEEVDDWLLAVRLYKGSIGNASTLAKDHWYNQCYVTWPDPIGKYENSSKTLSDLWKKRDTFTILIPQ